MNFTDQEWAELEKTCCQAAKQGGDVLTRWLGKTTTTEKGFRDLVTQADFESQAVIQEFLAHRFPDHRFIGEESEPDSVASKIATTDSEFCWIVDPLDGTTNFVHQLPSYSVSVALYHNKRPLAGAVFDPILNECYSAAIGTGARLNGEPIQTSGCTEIGQSLFVFSFSRGVKRNDPEVTRFLNMLEAVGSMRRLGSAALNLCYVASGRTDGYWATSLAKWDVAAGWLIATEAGAVLEDFSGAEIDLEKPHFCVAASKKLLQQVRPLLNVDSQID